MNAVTPKEAFMRDENDAPLARRSDILPPTRGGDPFAVFRQEMDQLFDRFFAPDRLTRFGLGGFPFNPALDMTENDKEVRLRAELPGVDEKDVEIRLDNDLITIRGEKREERSDDSDQRRVVERSYGSFERTLRLPFAPENNEVKAEFKDGVLTVTAKKPAGYTPASKRIPIVKL
jgi:HSP20 family protein